MPHDFKILNQRFSSARQTLDGAIGNEAMGISKHIALLKAEVDTMKKGFGGNLNNEQKAQSYERYGKLQVLKSIQEHFNELKNIADQSRAAISQKLESARTPREVATNTTVYIQPHESIITPEQQVDFLNQSRDIANTLYHGIAQYDSAFIEAVEMYAQAMIRVTDDYSEALGEPLHIKKSLLVEKTVQTIIDEAQKLQALFKDHKSHMLGKKPSPKLESELQLLLEKATDVKNMASDMLQVPNPRGDSDYDKAFRALVQQALQFKVETEKPENTQVLERDKGVHERLTKGVLVIIDFN